MKETNLKRDVLTISTKGHSGKGKTMGTVEGLIGSYQGVGRKSSNVGEMVMMRKRGEGQ